MPDTIEKVYIQTYENTVRHLAQQGIARLRPWVMEKSVQSEAHNWERLGAVEATSKSTPGNIGRAVPTPVDDAPWSRRVSMPSTWHVGELTEQEDVVQMLVDPNSNIAVAQGKAMRRAFDDAIIAAACGPAMDGDGNSVGYSASRAIGTAVAPVEMSFDLVTEVTERFMADDVDPEEEKVFVVSPAGARKLLQLTEATSGDFTQLRPLQSKGYVDSWMGYSWVVSTRLLSDSPSAPTYTEFFAMTRKALGLQINRDISVRVAEDPSVSFAWRVYCYATFGAVRVEDEQIVKAFIAA
jgi:hypothetical protein